MILRRSPRIALFFATLAGMVLSFAQAQAQSVDFESNKVAGRSNIIGFERLTSSFEFWLCVLIITLAIGLLAVEFFMFFKARHIPFRPDDVLRLVVTTLVVCGTLFCLAAGFSSEQIAPAIGLFGTVVGYLLGSADRRSASARSNEHVDKPEKPR
jgi:hypothetical protein